MAINVGLIKLAARAWKQHQLSEKNRSILESNGILDYDRELSGLRQGSDAIADRYRVTEVFRPGTDVGRTVIRKDKAKFNIRYDKDGSAYVKPGEPLYVPSATIEYGDKLYAANHRGVNPTSEWRKEIARRHELDEVAMASRKLTKRVRKVLGEAAIISSDTLSESAAKERMAKMPQLQDSLSMFGSDLDKDRIYTHYDPEVLIRESGNLAGAPAAARKYFTKLRANERPSILDRAAEAIAGNSKNKPTDHFYLDEHRVFSKSGVPYGVQVKPGQARQIGKRIREALDQAKHNWEHGGKLKYQIGTAALGSAAVLGTGYSLYKQEKDDRVRFDNTRSKRYRNAYQF